jgi:hypothetical protein
MMCRHIIVCLESIECVESHISPLKNAGTKWREHEGVKMPPNRRDG